MNTLRTPEFISAKHKIQHCKSMDELFKLRKAILQYGEPHADRAELMAYFLEKEQDLNPEYIAERAESIADEIETRGTKQANNNQR